MLFGLEHPQVALFADPGLGKTKAAIDLARQWLKNDGIKHILVVAPLAVLWNWEREIKLNSNYKCEVLYGTTAQRVRTLKKKAQFYIINYDAIIIPDILRALLSKGFGGVIFDESIKIKNYRSKRTQAAYAIARSTDLVQDKTWGSPWSEGKVVLLSGRPVSSGVDDLFGQFYVLDGGKTFGKNYFRFRNKYFRKIPVPFPKYRLREGALAEIRYAVETTSRVYRKQDCLDLPSRISKTYRVVLTPEQDNDIKKLRGSASILKEDGTKVLVSNVLSLLQKEQQITGGFVYGTQRTEKANLAENADSGEVCGWVGRGDCQGTGTDERRTYYYNSNPKLGVLREILTEELEGKPTIIVCRYLAELDRIRDVLLGDLGLGSVEISGRRDTHEEVTRFCTTDVPICLCQISAGSLGIDGLQTRSSDMVFYSLNYRMDDHDQMQHRIDRLGQTRPCTYYYLVGKDSIDEEIMAAIRRKVNISDYLMRRRK